MFRFPLYILLFLIGTSLIQGEISTEKELFASSQNPLASLYGVPETNVHGVNVINGSYNYAVIDFLIPGSDPLILERSYSTSTTQSRALFNGWTHNLCSVIATEQYGGEGLLKKKIPYSYFSRISFWRTPLFYSTIQTPPTCVQT